MIVTIFRIAILLLLLFKEQARQKARQEQIGSLAEVPSHLCSFAAQSIWGVYWAG